MDIGAVRMDGQSQKTEKASDAVRRFQNDPGIRVLVSNIQVSATGFTLTAADSSVFFSNSYRYDHRVQAVKRTHRIGQTRPVRYYDPVAAAVDENILQSLSTTQDVAVTTLDQLRELVDAL
jgi:SNF2 family DNA or RNA helicase